jgi:hypothetical protein
MAIEKIEESISEEKKIIRLAVSSSYLTPLASNNNPWSPEDYDKLDTYDLDNYKEIINDCRYFYKKDPIASTVVNKLIDIGITQLIVDQGTLSDNEYRIIDAFKDDLQEFLELGALEYLLTGLVIPEIELAIAPKNKLVDLGIKKYTSMLLPEVMWYRDSATVIINNPLIPSKPSYFIKIPDELAYFIRTKGMFKDGTKDEELYREISKLYPEMIKAINENKDKIPLKNDDIIRRRYLANSPYPIPYLYSALESLKHKRNIRRMDYSIAARVIGAIQLITLGDKDFPLTEEDSDQLEDIKGQMRHRDLYSKDLERVYQLFGNHTLKISWVFPDVAALLDEAKYRNVNNDIMYALGLPRILITGETERTGTSDSEFATLSPIKTMEDFRRKLLSLARKIINRVLLENKIKNRPSDIRFENINLHNFAEFVDALIKLNEGGAISKTTTDKILGFNFEEETKNRSKEKKLLEKYDLDVFDQVPFSPPPGQQKQVNNNKEDKENGQS